MKEWILFVDDDPNILEAYQRKLQHALHVRTAQGPHVGLRELKDKGPFAVVVADMNMPLMNGIEFLKRVRELSPDTVRVMLTGNSDIRVAMDAVNEGCVFRFLTKPCPSKLMADSLIAAIGQHRLVTAEKELLDGTLRGICELLTEILSWVNPQAFGRTMQLRNAALSIGKKLCGTDLWEIGIAATLSQLGAMAIPHEIISKLARDEALTDEESHTLRSVPAIGHDLIEQIPRLDGVAKIVLYQKKCFDGGGFPVDSVKGKDIPLGARILKAADDFYELRAGGMSRQACIKEMNSRDGWYDPAVLSVLDCGGTALPQPETATEVISVRFQDLKAGLTLGAPIETGTGSKLIDAGTVISDALLIRLKKHAETNSIREPIEVVIHR